MGRQRYPFSPQALAALRTLARPGDPPPTYRRLAEHLHRQKLTPRRVDPKILWRACRRLGITLGTANESAPGLAGRRPYSPPTLRITKASPGRCALCGCTDDRACPEGCCWANRAHTLCSACVSTAAGAAR